MKNSIRNWQRVISIVGVCGITVLLFAVLRLRFAMRAVLIGFLGRVGLCFLIFFTIVSIEYVRKLKKKLKLQEAAECLHNIVFEYDTAKQEIAAYGDSENVFAIEEKMDSLVHILQIFHPNDREKVMQAYKNPFRQNHLHVRVMDVQGNYRYCELRLHTAFGFKTNGRRVIGELKDVHEHVEKERRLSGEKRLLSDAVALMADSYHIIIMLNLDDGKVNVIRMEQWEMDELHLAEQQADSRLAYNEWRRHVVDKVVHPDYREEIFRCFSLERLRKTISRKGQSEEMVYRRKNVQQENYQWVKAVYTAGRDFGENNHTIFHYIKNIDQAKEAEENFTQRMEEAVREIDKEKREKGDLLQYITKNFQKQWRIFPVSADMKPKALVVEDNSLGRNILISLLDEEGYQVLEAESASEALEVYRDFGQNSIGLLFARQGRLLLGTQKLSRRLQGETRVIEN